MTKQNSLSRANWISAAVERYEGPLVRYAARLTGDVERARDIVQDAFLKLCRENPAELDGHLAQWLFTVCRNRALDVHKKESRMKTLSENQIDIRANGQANHEDALERKEAAGNLASLVASLPDNQQEVVRLKFQNGLSYREISSIMGLTESNVGYLIHTAIKSIRQQVAGSEI